MEADRIVQRMVHASHTLDVDTSPAPRGPRGKTADEVVQRMVDRHIADALGEPELPPLVTHSIEVDDSERETFEIVPIVPDIG